MRRLSFVIRGSVLASALAVSAPLLTVPAGATSPALTATAQFPKQISTATPLARLTFSAPVTAADLPLVRTSPVLNVTWQQTGPNSVQAVTTSLVIPDTTYQLSVPTSVTCATLCTTTTRVLRKISSSSEKVWMLELLAKLDFLPVSFTPSATAPVPTSNAQYLPGTFAWRFPQLPKSFQAMWNESKPGVILTGALMRFQNEHNLATTGQPNTPTWSALIQAARHDVMNTATYNYVYVTKTEPEHLVLYRRGLAKFQTLVNTGISSAPTADGTYPVYQRFLTTTMSGVEPDGQPYHDPGIPWVSYFHGGDALHGFIRSSYGWPQSLGCVEMPFSDAEVVYRYTPIGTLVTVQ